MVEYLSISFHRRVHSIHLKQPSNRLRERSPEWKWCEVSVAILNEVASDNTGSQIML